MRHMSITAIKRHIRMAPPITLAQIEKNAAAWAKYQREDCYVYVLTPGQCVIYSTGPDLEHPKREPAHIAHYVKPEKGVRT